MTFASDDYDRVLIDGCRLDIEGFRGLKTQRGNRLVRFVKRSALKHINDGVRDKHKLLKLVMEDAEEEFRGPRVGNPILIAIIAAVVQYVVLKILHRIFDGATE